MSSEKNMGLKYVRIDTVGLNKTLIRHYGKSGFEFLDIKPLKIPAGSQKIIKRGKSAISKKKLYKIKR